MRTFAFVLLSILACGTAYASPPSENIRTTILGYAPAKGDHFIAYQGDGVTEYMEIIPKDQTEQTWTDLFGAIVAPAGAQVASALNPSAGQASLAKFCGALIYQKAPTPRGAEGEYFYRGCAQASFVNAIGQTAEITVGLDHYIIRNGVVVKTWREWRGTIDQFSAQLAVRGVGARRELDSNGKLIVNEALLSAAVAKFSEPHFKDLDRFTVCDLESQENCPAFPFATQAGGQRVDMQGAFAAMLSYPGLGESVDPSAIAAVLGRPLKPDEDVAAIRVTQSINITNHDFQDGRALGGAFRRVDLGRHAGGGYLVVSTTGVEKGDTKLRARLQAYALWATRLYQSALKLDLSDGVLLRFVAD